MEKQWEVTLSTRYGSKRYAVQAGTAEQAEQQARAQAASERDYSLAYSGEASVKEVAGV